MSLDPFSTGFLIGLLVGEGHFGGDGQQPHITLRMHVRHEKVFRWLQATFPEGRLYGPYHHGGRHYFQIAAHLDTLDDHAARRFREMCDRYGLVATA
jgi:hypothetical protein